VFANAVPIAEFQGTVYAYSTNPSTTWHLWVKWKSVDGVESLVPAGGTNGVVLTTGQDVSLLVEAMTGPGNPFTVLATDTVIDGVTFPAGTYSTKAFVQDLQVTNGKIANLAVDDAKIASLSAAKITAGSIAVGQYIQGTGYVAGSAGWRINGDGTAEFSDVVVRGTVYATAGYLRGLEIQNSAGTVILSSGSTLSSQVQYSGISGTKPPANADNTASNTAAGIAGQGAFATLSQINPGNASTYIADLAVNTLQIAGNAVTIMDARNLVSEVLIGSTTNPTDASGVVIATTGNTTNILEFTLANNGSPFFVQATAASRFDSASTGFSYNIWAMIFINDVFKAATIFKGDSYSDVNPLFFYEKNPAPGNSKVSLRLSRQQTGGTIPYNFYAMTAGYYGYQGCTLSAVGLKK
jgi:hypothetical protein